jgi:hypothetical protein
MSKVNKKHKFECQEEESLTIQFTLEKSLKLRVIAWKVYSHTLCSGSPSMEESHTSLQNEPIGLKSGPLYQS